MAGVSGVGAVPATIPAVLSGSGQSLDEQKLDQQFEVALLNNFQQFGQQLPGNVSPSNLISSLTEKAKSGSNQADPASSDLDTGVQ